MRRRSSLRTWLLLAFGLAAALAANGEEAPLPEGVSFDFLAEDEFSGDLPEMMQRGRIRALVVYDKSSFLIVNGRARGFEHDLLRAFEDHLNEAREPGTPPVAVVFKPVSSAELLPALEAGLGDLVAAGMTITPARQARVSFSKPYLEGIDEVLVSRKDRPAAGTAAALAGKEIHVPRGSSYAEHLAAISAEISAAGLEPFHAVETDAAFEAEDLLEGVNGGVIDYTVVDRHKAELWSQVMKNIRIEDDLVANEGGEIAWAVRKKSPLLRARIDEFLVSVKETYPSAFHTRFKRYFESPRWVRTEQPVLLSPHVQQMTGYFQKYSRRYEIDWLLMFAQGFQESRLDPEAVSSVGALGVMQLLPSTAADMGFEDVSEPEPNIHAGIKYMDWIRNRYFVDEELPDRERVFMALAAYNAGPNRIARLRARAPEMGLDPNRWFGNMELVTLASVGMEPVQYVSSIYKYYLSYSRWLFDLSTPSQRKQDIAKIQTRLVELGYAAGGADGIMGKQTRQAIRAYQQDHGLAIDGRPSLSLMFHLEERSIEGRSAAGS